MSSKRLATARRSLEHRLPNDGHPKSLLEIIATTSADQDAVVCVARCTWSSPDGVVLTGKSCVAFLDSDEKHEAARGPVPSPPGNR